MTTEIVILAQGTQKRMGSRHGYKQLLPLAACDNVQLMARTLVQLGRYTTDDDRVVIVASKALHACMDLMPFPSLHHVELADPGNSSLKGIARYLESRPSIPDATVVLLGDVLYSWACLDALAAASQRAGFVGTHDLRNDGGELWGVAWSQVHDDTMMRDLADALLRHPPFNDEYQPGQMRRWISGWRRGDLRSHVSKLTREGEYFSVDDYTMDVDIPTHIPQLAQASVFAAEDDARHGIQWVSRRVSAAE